MDKSVICSIGINNYIDASISQLSYSTSDACKITRAFKAYNLVDEAVSLTNSEATVEEVKKLLIKLGSNYNVLFLYISSHAEQIKNTSYICCYDTKMSSISNSALPLPELISLLKELNFNKVIVAIDACNVESNQIKLNCIRLLYPNDNITYEDTYNSQSEFSLRLLHLLARFNKSQKDKKRSSNRYDTVRRIIADKFYLSKTLKKTICLTGKTGLGKSHFLKNIKAQEDYTFYVSIPNRKHISIEFIHSLIAAELFECLSEQANCFYDTNPERYIHFYLQQLPQSLLIIDHVDHLSKSVLSQLLKFLDILPIHMILASRVNPITKNSIPEVQLPNISYAQMQDFFRDIGADNIKLPSKYQVEFFDTYLELFKYISKQIPQSNSALNLDRARCAIALTGGFINEDIFTYIFNIQPEHISLLRKRGILIKHGDFSLPHDTIYKNISEVYLENLSHLACNYWREEYLYNNNSIEALYHLVLTINTIEPRHDAYPDDFYITLINKLRGRNNIYYLTLLCDYLTNNCIHIRLLTHIIESLIRVGLLDKARKALNKKNNISILSLDAELNWWEGNFENSISLSNPMIETLPNCQLLYDCYCNRAIGNFFLGNWNMSIADFTLIISNKENCTEKTLFFSNCVFGTINGLRGHDIKNSVQRLIDAISLGKAAGNLEWIMLTYGNIGEILWKAGYYEQSSKILIAAKELAYLTGNDIISLEIDRNLLHAYYFLNNNKLFNKLLESLSNDFNQRADSYVNIQLVNTLITHLLFTQNSDYKKYLEASTTITEHNKEYRIYTLSNQALASLANNDIENATKTITDAIALCESGKNWLALKQIMRDWDVMANQHLVHDRVTKEIFQKSYRTLETSISPTLHHFEALIEYLELH